MITLTDFDNDYVNMLTMITRTIMALTMMWLPIAELTTLKMLTMLIMTLQGTNVVKYSVKGWRHVAHTMGRTNLATELLRKTSR